MKFCKPSCSHDNLGVALIYRKNDSALSFYKKLESLNSVTNLNFIVGDFNLDAFSHKIFIRPSNILSNFRLLSNKSSHLNVTHIDQPYFIKTMFQEATLNASIVTVYFSDHNALKIQYQFNKAGCSTFRFFSFPLVSQIFL